MIELNRNQRKTLTPLFQGQFAGYTAESILQGHIGRVLADQSPANFAVLELPHFNLCILGGNPEHPSVPEYLKGLSRFSMLFFGSEDFATVAHQVHPQKWVVMERYAFSSENLNIDRLRKFTTRLPAGFQVKRIDVELATQLLEDKQNKFADHHGRNFDSPEDFVTRGFGYCVLADNEIACIASTFAVCDGGMEIQIDTKRKYRQKGLATVAAAHLIIHSLEQNIDPGWDAATKTSAKFAQKLGYTPQGTYPMYVFTGSKFLVYLRAVMQRLKKLWTKPEDDLY